MRNPVVVNLVLLLIAVLWGFGFIPQREGMEYVGPFAFNGTRFALGALTLLPILLLANSIKLSDCINQSTLKVGSILGALLFSGAAFQQLGIQYTSLAKVAFITGLYAIIVPIIGFFLGYRYKLIVWAGGLLAIVGLYFMTGSSTDMSQRGDLLVLVGAVFWAIHLLVLAKFSGQHNQLVLAFWQFVVCAVLSIACALSVEGQILPHAPIGYFCSALNGILVVGVAYTLQVVVMDHAEPFIASLVLSLEAVFGAVAGYLYYQEILSLAGLVGAGLMLVGCLLAQLPNAQQTKEAIAN